MKNELGLRNVGVYMGKGLAQAIFEPNLFPCIPQHFSNLVHSSHLPAYEDGTDRVF